jgi:hypothetical protein
MPAETTSRDQTNERDVPSRSLTRPPIDYEVDEFGIYFIQRVPRIVEKNESIARLPGEFSEQTTIGPRNSW